MGGGSNPIAMYAKKWQPIWWNKMHLCMTSMQLKSWRCSILAKFAVATLLSVDGHASKFCQDWATSALQLHRCRAKMHLVSSDWQPIFWAYMSVSIDFKGKTHLSGLRRQRIPYNVRDGRRSKNGRPNRRNICCAKMHPVSSDWPPIFLTYIVRVIVVRGPF